MHSRCIISSHILQELTLACTRITHNANIDIATEIHPLGSLFVHTTQKLKKNTLLNNLVTYAEGLVYFLHMCTSTEVPTKDIRSNTAV